ncbi:MAG: ABC transporter ATP-binding protein [Candidatus Eisenbacteria bacterium]|nr:ABC transporter ATP-binding protein [Candidatus Eisenbacteria bacterium]
MTFIHPIHDTRTSKRVDNQTRVTNLPKSLSTVTAIGPVAPVSVHNLRRYYRGRWGKKVEALKGVSLEAPAGQVTGLLGPNGAGKTTTLRIILGMLRASSGIVRLFGGSVNDPASRKRLGFLTEQPYFYDYLTARELLDLCGVLCDVAPADRRRRSGYWLERMGLSHAADLRLRKFSKGMLQRLGLAQALIHEPELVILDEPMSGLDPLGRSLVRDVILELKQRGATVLFSSHVLPDVETLCDRVTVVAGGSVVLEGSVADLVADTDAEFEIVVSQVSPGLAQALSARGIAVATSGSRLLIAAPDRAAMNRLVAELIRDGAEIAAVAPRRSPLEQRFLAAVRQAGGSGGMHDGGPDTSDARTAARATVEPVSRTGTDQ